MKIIKKDCIRKLLIVVLVLTLCPALFSCASKMSDGEASEILSSLLPSAEKITEVVWGEGLPAVPGAEAVDSVTAAQYYPVDPACGYSSIADIKAEAEKVFTAGYLKNIYSVAFGEYERKNENGSDAEKETDPAAINYDKLEVVKDVGAEEEEVTGLSAEQLGLERLDGRYAEKDGVLCVDITNPGFGFDTKIDPDSARVIKRGAGIIVCEADCVCGGESGTIRLTLKEQNGVWLLDGPVY